MGQNIAQLALSYAADPGAISISGDDRRLSRRDVRARVAQRIAQLRELGVEPGGFVILFCDRGISFWIDILALWALGARPVCLESDVEPAHWENVLDITRAGWISGGAAAISGGLRTVPEIDWDAPLAGRGDVSFYRPADDEIAGLIFTSGTTGLPKGVPLTHRALSLNALGTASRLRLGPGDRLMIATPFRFISSISHFIVTLLAGASFHGVERKLMPGDLIKAIEEERITAFGGSPFHARFIAMADASRLPRLRWLMSSGDHLPKAVISDLRRAFPGLAIHTVYGMAELAGRFCTLAPEFVDDCAGSVGLPIPGLRLQVLNDDGAACGPHEIGSIFASGDIAFSGYYRNAAADQSVITPNGFKTGDLGYVDERGFVYLSGRSDSVFKRSGVKVSAQTITDAILSLGVFDDVVVLSRPDPVEGAAPVAYVAGGDESIGKGDLLRMLRPALSGKHLPKELVRVAEIPRTGSGKVDRRRLKALAGRSD